MSDRAKTIVLLIVAAAALTYALASFLGKKRECEARGLEIVRPAFALAYHCGTVEK